MKLYLHIGAEKTGTSTIQEFLLQNKTRLLEQGFYYLHMPGRNEYRDLATCCIDYEKTDDYLRQKKIVSLAERKSFNKRTRAEFIRAIQNIPSSTQNVILSSEHLSSRLTTDVEVLRLRDILKPHFDSIEIVFYIREHTSKVCSAYSTRIKSGGIRSFKRFLNEYIQLDRDNYDARLKSWESAFSFENITLKIYHKYHSNHGLIHSFAKCIGFETRRDFHLPQEPNNSSLSARALSLLRFINLFYPIQLKRIDKISTMHRHIIRYLSQNITGKHIALNNSQRCQIEEHYRKSNEAVRQRYFPNKKDLFPDTSTPLLKKVLLHAGGDKTGSTSIQSFMDQNRDSLSDHGYLYAPELLHTKLTAHFAADPIKIDYYQVRAHITDFDELRHQAAVYVANLFDLIHQGNHHTLIISYEGLDALNENELTKLREYLLNFSNNIEILYYIRPRLSYAVSAISERVKHGRPSWIQHPPITLYQNKLKRFADVFGRDSLTVAVYDPDRNAISDYMDRCRIPSSISHQMKQANDRLNSSLSEPAIQIADSIRELTNKTLEISEIEYKEIFLPHLDEISGNTYQLSQLQKSVISKSTAADNGYLLKEYGIHLENESECHFDPAKDPANITRSLTPATATKIALQTIKKALPDFQGPVILPTLPEKESIVTSAEGHLELISITSTRSESLATIHIYNRSATWWGGKIAPVCASYHWLDTSGEVLSFDGQRTLLPDSGIEPGNSLIMPITIVIPNLEDGDYVLEITMVQEFFNWFENLGFKSSKIHVAISDGIISASNKAT